VKPIELYRRMARARALELALGDLWRQGRISGEMHLGTGEEAVAAAVTAHLRPGDALALDHRPTTFMAARGLDLVPILKECLGRQDGLCHGHGGHMHLMSRDDLTAASGIVGSSGPAGAGFALAAKLLRPGSVAVAVCGEGAVNQGMLMESMNLAVAWKLPLVFVCKDNRWAITTESRSVTGGDLVQRALGFGLQAERVDGLDVEATAAAVDRAVTRARRREGPSFIVTECARLDGHLLGDTLLRIAHSPVAEGSEVLGKAIGDAITKPGGGIGARAASLFAMTVKLQRVKQDARGKAHDPIIVARRRLQREHVDVEAVEAEIHAEIERAVDAATDGAADA
jgi:pyruvate dehydrogenase E1 component alpha subunit